MGEVEWVRSINRCRNPGQCQVGREIRKKVVIGQRAKRQAKSGHRDKVIWSNSYSSTEGFSLVFPSNYDVGHRYRYHILNKERDK